MELIRAASDLHGATILEARFISGDEKLVLFLNENRYAVVEAQFCHEDGADVGFGDSLKDDDELFEAGLISKAEKDRRDWERFGKQQKERAEATRRSELEQLRRLQIKYPTEAAQGTVPDHQSAKELL